MNFFCAASFDAIGTSGHFTAQSPPGMLLPDLSSRDFSGMHLLSRMISHWPYATLEHTAHLPDGQSMLAVKADVLVHRVARALLDQI